MNTPNSSATSGSLARRLRIGGLLLVLVVFGGIALWTWLTLSWSYSTGERAGYVQKFSRKGWLCKTWEGELSLVAIPGSMPEIFRFSVRDEQVAAAVNEAMGQRVALSYAQHIGIPSACFGETEYFVTGVHAIQLPVNTQ
jgi:hypothetical protein